MKVCINYYKMNIVRVSHKHYEIVLTNWNLQTAITNGFFKFSDAVKVIVYAKRHPLPWVEQLDKWGIVPSNKGFSIEDN